MSARRAHLLAIERAIGEVLRAAEAAADDYRGRALTPQEANDARAIGDAFQRIAEIMLRAASKAHADIDARGHQKVN